MVLLSVGIWIVILVYAYLPERYTKFAQDSCRGSTVAESFFLGAPFVFAYLASGRESGGFGCIPHDSHPRHRRLGHRDYSEEEGNLATW